MSVSLRLSRGGSKKRPFFRIVAADIRSPRDGKYLERLGTYNPMRSKDDPERITLNTERIKYWLSVGAKPTDRVTKFLATEGLAKKPSIPEQTKQDKPRKKTLEKLKAKEEKLKSKQDLVEASKESTEVQATTSTTQQPPKIETPAETKPAEAKTTDQETPKTETPVETKPAEAKTTDQETPKTETPVETKPTEQLDDKKENSSSEEKKEG